MTKSCGDRVRVVIVGGGPAGIGAALALDARGVGPVMLIERWPELGGVPAKYRAKSGGVPTFVVPSRGRIMFGETYAAMLRDRLAKTSTQVHLEGQVLSLDPKNLSLSVVSPTGGCFTVHAEAIVLACGAREKTRAERGWIDGPRPARVFYTMQLLELLERHGRLPCRAPLIIGSDLIGYSAAAKLKAAGVRAMRLCDRTPGPRCPLPARWYFRRWVRPGWRSVRQTLRVLGDHAVEAAHLDEHQAQRHDGVLISGLLVPNSELLVQAGLRTEQPGHTPVLERDGMTRAAGCFVAGNGIGGFHGASWCYHNGKRVGRAVAGYLARS